MGKDFWGLNILMEGYSMVGMVVFDLDGMLVDMLGDLIVVVNVCFIGCGLLFLLDLVEDVLIVFYGGWVMLCVGYVWIVVGMLLFFIVEDEDYVCLLGYYGDVIVVYMWLYLGIEVVLDVLVDVGYILFVCINKFEVLVEILLCELGICDCFGVLVGVDILFVCKFDFCFY